MENVFKLDTTKRVGKLWSPKAGIKAGWRVGSRPNVLNFDSKRCKAKNRTRALTDIHKAYSVEFNRLHVERRVLWRELKKSWWFKKPENNYSLTSMMLLKDRDIKIPAKGKVRRLLLDLDLLTNEINALTEKWRAVTENPPAAKPEKNHSERFDSRLHRIRNSLNKINGLMADLKQLETDKSS